MGEDPVAIREFIKITRGLVFLFFLKQNRAEEGMEIQAGMSGVGRYHGGES